MVPEHFRSRVGGCGHRRAERGNGNMQSTQQARNTQCSQAYTYMQANGPNIIQFESGVVFGNAPIVTNGVQYSLHS